MTTYDDLLELACDSLHARFCNGGPMHDQGMHTEQAAAVLDALMEIFAVWGSDCLACGNATSHSQRCDLCGSDASTMPLYYDKRVAEEKSA